MMRIDADEAALTTALARDRPALAASLGLARSLLTRAPTAAADGELQRAVAEAERLLAIDADNPSGEVEPTWPAGWPSEEQIAWCHRKIAARAQLAAGGELALCVLRTFLACARRDGLTADLEPAAQAALGAALEAHRAHRLDERDCMLAAARSSLDYARRQPGSERTIAASLALVERLVALDEATLLCDRRSTR